MTPPCPYLPPLPIRLTTMIAILGYTTAVLLGLALLFAALVGIALDPRE